ncbi:efflux RND transporter periplasmic adaptor subunit [Thioclava sp.]|uniref:efflux RND transporter periplasmic adaptor subunit n=1 Tax=Thioclava sp. TaxID=1933450 RepID=UPI003AA8B564
MAPKKKHSRLWMGVSAVVLIGAGLTYAFWPRPTLVDMGQVARTPMAVTINEEGQTQVHNTYVVSTPFAGRLLRVQVVSGDVVKGGETVVAKMLPANPDALDMRTRDQARADISSAEAAVQAAQAGMAKALADKDLADSTLRRTQGLRAGGTTSAASLDQAQQGARVAQAAVDTARADIAMKIAALDSARARLVRFSDPHPLTNGQPPQGSETTPVTAPVSGRVLQVLQVSETTLPAGTPILQVGDVSGDLEVLSQLLSTDAVQVTLGDRVIIDGWGGAKPLSGVVDRVDPWGFTKVSALGVEEQRVNTIIRFTDPADARKGLGSGYRVEVRIITWEDANALTVPASALFRNAGKWAVFVVTDGKAHLTPVSIGHTNGTQAEVLSGLDAGAEVVLYPGAGLADGAAVAQRTTN